MTSPKVAPAEPLPARRIAYGVLEGPAMPPGSEPPALVMPRRTSDATRVKQLADKLAVKRETGRDIVSLALGSRAVPLMEESGTIDGALNLFSAGPAQYGGNETIFNWKLHPFANRPTSSYGAKLATLGAFFAVQELGSDAKLQVMTDDFDNSEAIDHGLAAASTVRALAAYGWYPQAAKQDIYDPLKSCPSVLFFSQQPPAAVERRASAEEYPRAAQVRLEKAVEFLQEKAASLLTETHAKALAPQPQPGSAIAETLGLPRPPDSVAADMERLFAQLTDLPAFESYLGTLVADAVQVSLTHPRAALPAGGEVQSWAAVRGIIERFKGLGLKPVSLPPYFLSDTEFMRWFPNGSVPVIDRVSTGSPTAHKRTLHAVQLDYLLRVTRDPSAVLDFLFHTELGNRYWSQLFDDPTSTGDSGYLDFRLFCGAMDKIGLS